jgi:prepilin-type N-terminal cleavage/methylation domain-containing protein
MSSNHSPRQAETTSSVAGYTLVEVLVSLVILSVGLVLVLESFQAASLALEKGRDHLAMSRVGSDIRQRCAAEVQQHGALQSPRGESAWFGCRVAWVADLEELALPGRPVESEAVLHRLTVALETSGGNQLTVSTFVAELPEPEEEL